jgi:hypothetical protein
VTIGRDQLRALAVLRYWFGDLEVLAVLEHDEAEACLAIESTLAGYFSHRTGGRERRGGAPSPAYRPAARPEHPRSGPQHRPPVKAGRQAIPKGRAAALTVNKASTSAPRPSKPEGPGDRRKPGAFGVSGRSLPGRCKGGLHAAGSLRPRRGPCPPRRGGVHARTSSSTPAGGGTEPTGSGRPTCRLQRLRPGVASRPAPNRPSLGSSGT